MHRGRVKHALRNALAAASALNEENGEIIKLAISGTEEYSEPRQRALILSDIARLVTADGSPEKGLEVLLLALEHARLAGRDTVLEVLAAGAETLSSIDDGEFLIRIAHELEAIDDWFGAG
jgi:hypothetical protein